ncbi:armadillo-type fold protein [Tanacetum coccineum]
MIEISSTNKVFQQDPYRILLKITRASYPRFHCSILAPENDTRKDDEYGCGARAAVEGGWEEAVASPMLSMRLLPVLESSRETLISKVDQSPKKTLLDALKPSMKALIRMIFKLSDVNVKVAVASCISEITRITAPDAPYDDDQMRDVFQLIVSSFEDLADQSSRSYIRRASILETVSKVRSCVIMLDLECDEMIVEMFEHFLRSVRDYHRGVIYSSMENIMILVLEESEDISVEILKPLLATVKKHNEGVLPIAQKLGEDVLKKSAEKLKPYLMPALTALGDSLDTYSEIVTRVCEGTTAAMKRDDENDSGQQPADESKQAKGSQDETQQADDSKITTASSDHVDQVDKEEPCPQEEVNVDPMEGSPKLVMNNGVNVTGNEETLVDQESSKQIRGESDVKPQIRAGKMAVVAWRLKSATIDSSEDDEAASDSDEEPPLKISKKLEHVNSGRKSKQSGKKAVVTKEVKFPDTIDSSEYDEAASDSDEEPPLKVSKKLEPVNLGSKSKQSGKMAVVTKEVKAPATIDSSEDEEAASSSDDELLPKISKKLEPVNSGSKPKQPGKKVGAGDSDAKQAKQSVKKSDAKFYASH